MNTSQKAHVPSISVVIPHMNQPGFLQRSLSALAVQKNIEGLEIEIIVVDNGSRKLPTEICSAYENVLLAQEPEPGPGPARNKGVSLDRKSVV